MRVIALAVSLALLGAAALAGQSLWQVLHSPPSAVGAVQIAARQGMAPGPVPPLPPRRWPALFGEAEVAEPQPPTPPQPPQPPASAAPPVPPMEGLGYVLQGVVRAGASEWAIIGHPTGQRIVKVGEELADGITVIAMDEAGLLLERGGTEARLTFPE